MTVPDQHPDPLDAPQFWQGHAGTYCEKCHWESNAVGDQGVQDWEQHAREDH